MDNDILDSTAHVLSEEVNSVLPSEPSLSSRVPGGADVIAVSTNSEQVIPSAAFMKHGVYTSQSTVSPFPVKPTPSAGQSSEEEPLLVIGTTVLDSKVR